MNYELQNTAPLHEALRKHMKNRIVRLDVPGHKGGRMNKELKAFLGEQVMACDVNSMKNLDNLCHPVSVIYEAEQLAADAFGAAHAYFMVGGTTSAVQSMVLTACKAGDKIILPRNVHRSVINALVLCGAEPVYVNPDVDAHIGIALGMELGTIFLCISDNGRGADTEKLTPGFGLRHMEERLALLKGRVRYWSDQGFTLEVLLPANEEASKFL